MKNSTKEGPTKIKFPNYQVGTIGKFFYTHLVLLNEPT